jgi:hypothetical protein
MSPLGANAIALGWLKFAPDPLTPAVPNLSKTFPSGENLNTCWPLPSFAWPSVTQTLPSASIAMPCGITINPPPKLCSSLPV